MLPENFCVRALKADMTRKKKCWKNHENKEIVGELNYLAGKIGWMQDRKFAQK